MTAVSAHNEVKCHINADHRAAAGNRSVFKNRKRLHEGEHEVIIVLSKMQRPKQPTLLSKLNYEERKPTTNSCRPYVSQVLSAKHSN